MLNLAQWVLTEFVLHKLLQLPFLWYAIDDVSNDPLSSSNSRRHAQTESCVRQSGFITEDRNTDVDPR
jgi:hypothetical protein